MQSAEDAAVRITSPTAVAAFVLLDLLEEHDPVATPEADGTWQVRIPLRGASTVREVLSAARGWLEECGLHSASVTVDGRTQLLRSGRATATR